MVLMFGILIVAVRIRRPLVGVQLGVVQSTMVVPAIGFCCLEVSISIGPLLQRLLLLTSKHYAASLCTAGLGMLDIKCVVVGGLAVMTIVL